MDELPTAKDAAPNSSVVPASGHAADPWRILIATGLIACLPTIAAFGARLWWPLELFVHFRAYYTVGFLLATTVFLLGRRWKWAAVWALFCVWNLAGIVPLYFPPTRSLADGAGDNSIKLLVANVHTENREYRRFIDLIKKERPDVVIAIEVDTNWVLALQTIEADFPHRKIVPRSDNFGIALYSRLPATLEAKNLGSANVPTIVARFSRGKKPITLIATHPLPPVNSEYAAWRNDQLASVARFVRELETPVIVAGDLNTTSWSPYFQDFIGETGLVDSRRGFGIQPTWTGGRRIVRIPLDHVLVSREIEVEDRRVGDDIGSDHFPIVAKLSTP